MGGLEQKYGKVDTVLAILSCLRSGNMKNIEYLPRPDLSHIGTLAFAGGGNRCWWQAGVLSRLFDVGWQLPSELVGTSAGAAIAASCLTDGPASALASCLRLYASNEHIFDWRSLTKFKLRFAHQRIYPAWIESFLNPDSFAKVRTSRIRLLVGITRPARALGLAGSVAVGTIAYIVDKHLWHSIHPFLPRLLGLRQDFVDLQTCEVVAEAQALLGAAAAAPPLMSPRRVGGSFAIDGGYTDNAPIHEQSPDQKSRTLVLLTRHYPGLPNLFRWRGRVYWQPSRRVPVSTWDCTAHTTVREAFGLGEQDADSVLQGGVLGGA